MRASVDQESFRAFCFVPLTDAKLRERLLHPQAKLLMRFPVDSVPFIPDGYWYGKRKKSVGCYRQKNTNMVLLMYESVIKGHLPPLEDEFFQSLASWFMSVSPDKHHNKNSLQFTGIPMRFYENVRTQIFPEEWKLWQVDLTKTTPVNDTYPSRNQYVGAIQDGKHIGASPFSDIIGWDRVATHLGLLPDSFRLFLSDVGIPYSQLSTVHDSFINIMREHSYKLFKLYWSLQRQVLLNGEQSQDPTPHVMETNSDYPSVIIQDQTPTNNGVSHHASVADVTNIEQIYNTKSEWLLYNEDDILCDNYDSESDPEQDNIYIINPQLVIDLTPDPHIDCPLP
jgi:hypothetical protein